MAQLKMYWAAQPTEFPESYGGFSYRILQNTPQDIAAWVSICKHDFLKEDAGEQAFNDRMLDQDGFTYDSVYLVDYAGEPVATVTAIVRTNGVMGSVHMVAAVPSCRGKGVGKLLIEIAKARLFAAGVTGVDLTTDEFRVPAVRSYLRAGFLPVLYDEGMPQRWEAWLREQGYQNIPMVDEAGKFVMLLAQSDAVN